MHKNILKIHLSTRQSKQKINNYYGNNYIYTFHAVVFSVPIFFFWPNIHVTNDRYTKGTYNPSNEISCPFDLLLKCVHIDTSCVNISPAVIYLMDREKKNFYINYRRGQLSQIFIRQQITILPWHLFHIGKHTCCIFE